jgi:hypothetical protein
MMSKDRTADPALAAGAGETGDPGRKLHHREYGIPYALEDCRYCGSDSKNHVSQCPLEAGTQGIAVEAATTAWEEGYEAGRQYLPPPFRRDGLNIYRLMGYRRQKSDERSGQ